MTKLAVPAKSRRGKKASRPAIVNSAGCPQHCAGATPIIRDAIIQAAVEAGEGDMVAYLKKLAETHPSAFLTLLGKVLPMQLTGGRGEPVNLEFSVRFVTADPTDDPTGD